MQKAAAATAARATTVAKKAWSMRRFATRWNILGLLFAAVGLLVLYAGVRYKEEKDREEARRLKVPTTSDAAQAIDKLGIDDADGEPHPASIYFARWLAGRWRETHFIGLAPGEQTTFDKAIERPSRERGKRICMPAVFASPLTFEETPEGRVFDGTFFGLYSREAVRYYAVGPNKDQPRDSEVKDRMFCGFFVGRESYRSKAGDTVRAIRLVGDFFPATDKMQPTR